MITEFYIYHREKHFNVTNTKFTVILNLQNSVVHKSVYPLFLKKEEHDSTLTTCSSRKHLEMTAINIYRIIKYQITL